MMFTYDGKWVPLRIIRPCEHPLTKSFHDRCNNTTYYWIRCLVCKKEYNHSSQQEW